MRDALPFHGIPMVFLYEPEINPIEMIVVNDLLVIQNLMFSLNLQKRNEAETKMVDNFLATSQGVY